MPKKFEIKQPERCKSCDKADNCDFLTRLFQKPFDASGALLDCKAFYFVFCDLEERCNTNQFLNIYKCNKMCYNENGDER